MMSSEIERKQLQNLKEEAARLARLIAEAEAGPKTLTEALFALCAKVRGGKVNSDKDLCELVAKFIKEEIDNALAKSNE